MDQIVQPLRALLDRVPKPAARWSRLFALAVLIGVCAGLTAAGLEWALTHGAARLVGRFTHLGHADVLRFDWWVLLLPALGGLASGVVVRLLAPRATGHGTDVLTRAFHRELGELPLRGPAVKGAASIGVIACGGSAGPEGPVAALGAAIGSSFGKWFGVTPRERRVMLVAGCAAGVGAIFRCPLGGALFAAGVLYSEPEFESDAIVPSFVSSVIAYSMFMFCFGFGEPLLGGATELAFSSPWELLPYAALGLICGLLAIFFSVCLRTVEHRLVPKIAAPLWVIPALGGLATGLLACGLPQVMDGRYVFTQGAMDGTLFGGVVSNWWWWTWLFLGVALAKCVATALTIGSGASGGVLGPSVFIGGAAGAFLGALLEALFPGTVPESLRMSLIPVGMGGVLAATMRTPLAAIVMVTEMTGGYGLIVPLMLVCVSAYVVGRRFGLNHEQVRTAADSRAHAADGVIHLLESWRVHHLMTADWPFRASPNATLRELVAMLKPGTRPVFAVVDEGRLCGVISIPDIERIMGQPGMGDAVIARDIMTERVMALSPDDSAYVALNAFRREHHDVLPVTEPCTDTTGGSESRRGLNAQSRADRWLGMLTRRSVFDALQRHIEETQQHVMREHAGLHEIDQEGQLRQLVMAVTPVETDRVQRLMVPIDAVGQSIRASDMRQRFGIQVLGIELPDGSLQFPPDLDMPLQPSHRLVAVIDELKVERSKV